MTATVKSNFTMILSPEPDDSDDEHGPTEELNRDGRAHREAWSGDSRRWGIRDWSRWFQPRAGARLVEHGLSSRLRWRTRGGARQRRRQVDMRFRWVGSQKDVHRGSGLGRRWRDYEEEARWFGVMNTTTEACSKQSRSSSNLPSFILLYNQEQSSSVR